MALPMLVTPSGIVTLVRPLQSRNAQTPMLVTLEGMVMLVNPLQALSSKMMETRQKTGSFCEIFMIWLLLHFHGFFNRFVNQL